MVSSDGDASAYEELAIRWGETPLSDYRVGNRLFRQMHRTAMKLKRSPEGRAQLERLAQHPVRAVRLSAAAECLTWSSEIALATLRALAEEPDLLAHSAKETLKSYEAGTLNMDW
jgi:hypothetical protein